jgi:large subunit ribosomal protein L21
MKYAVIKLAGHQYKVSEGEEILVDKLGDSKPNAEILLFVNDQKVEVGNPRLTNRKVELKVIGEEKGKKLHVKKYKAKSRYRRKIGFRPKFTRLSIEKIA